MEETQAGLTRRDLIAGGVAWVALPHIASFAEPDMKASDLTLHYDRPAKIWTEALPIGNGRLAGMVFGGVPEERIALNEAYIWAGGPHTYDNSDALAALPEIRRLIFAGHYKEAHDLTQKSFMGRPMGQAPYQPLGELLISFDHGGEPTEYRRELDLDSAVASTSYVVKGIRFTREVFASHPAHLIVWQVAGDAEGHVSFSVRFASQQKVQTSVDDGVLRIDGISGETNGMPGAVRFVGLARVETTGGLVTAVGDRIVVQNADSARIYFSAGTNYRSYQDLSGDAGQVAHSPMNQSKGRSFDELRRAHVADHRRLFRRMSLDLGPSNVEMQTDARIRAFGGAKDPGLAALYFQYGRYLMIAGSRPGGPPLTLQGPWNDKMNPPWGSKYTININTEMNYWPAENCNLSECHEPLFGLIADIAQTGARTARSQYGAGGWVAHHNTDGWRGTAPVDGASWGIWPMGGAWLCTHIWNRFQYTGNERELRQHFPLMKGAAEFFLDALVPEPGTEWLVTCPSISPEHEHHPGVSICAGPTMDNQILARPLWRLHRRLRGAPNGSRLRRSAEGDP